MQWSKLFIRKWQQAMSWLETGEPTPPYPLTPDEWACMLAEEEQEQPQVLRHYKQPLPGQLGLWLRQSWAVGFQARAPLYIKAIFRSGYYPRGTKGLKMLS